MRNKFFIILAILFLASTLYYWSLKKEQDILVPSIQRESVVPTSYQDKVLMLSPKSGDTVSSPVTIKGSVSGTWFFEGVVLGKVTDEAGKLLGQGPLMAKEEWMTEESVFFEGILPFDISGTKGGFVVIEADNPSGMGTPRSFRIPVIFNSLHVNSCTGPDCDAFMCTTGEVASNGVCVHEETGI